MTAPEIQQLKADYILLAAYFGTEIQDDVLVAYANDLADMSYEAVKGSMTALRRDPKTIKLPLPSAVRARLTPESNPDSEAVMVTGRILEAIAKYGPYRIEEAKHWIGPVGWILVKMEGGWEHLNCVHSDDLGTMKAQWRQTARALIERGAGTVSDAPQIEGGKRSEGLTSLGEMLDRITQRPTDV